MAPATHRHSVARAAAWVLGIAAAVIGAWYLAMLGTKSPVMLIAIGLGYGVAYGLVRGLGRHGVSVAITAVVLDVIALVVGLFYINRWQLNHLPQNHIPAWANPGYVKETLRVALQAWPTQWLWIVASLAVAGLVGWKGVEIGHDRIHGSHLNRDATAAELRSAADSGPIERATD